MLRLSVEDNVDYARRCLSDSVHRGEAPIASHLLFTQPGVLDDEVPEERKLGMDAGHAWYSQAHRCVVYTDHGISNGMQRGIELASQHGVPVEFRKLGVHNE
jgi:hypothetical protein